MMQYLVKITITEQYTTWVEAESEEAAEDLATKQLSNGDLCLDYESVTAEVIDTDDE